MDSPLFHARTSPREHGAAGPATIALAARDLASLRREKLALAATFAGAVLYAIACFRA